MGESSLSVCGIKKKRYQSDLISRTYYLDKRLSTVYFPHKSLLIIMSVISKDDLRKEIDGILEGADLDTLSSKKVRQQLEEKLNFDLTDRKKEIDELVMEAVENKPTEDGVEKKKKIADDSGDENDEEKEKEPANKKVKGDKSDESDDEEEEANDAESVEEKGEEEEEEEEDEYQPDGDDSPKRKGRQGSRQSSRKSPAEPEAKRGRPSRSDINKKSLAENSSESEEEKSAESEESEESDAAPAPAPAGKKRGPKPKAARKSEDAVQKPAKVARQEYSDSEFDEYSTNSSDHASDDDYAPGKKSPGKKKAAGRGGRGRGTPGRKRKMDSTDPEDSDEDWKKATQRKRTPNAKKGS